MQWENEFTNLAPRKITNQNIIFRLRRRETDVARAGTEFLVARSFHQNVFPNFTVVNVEKPPCFLRKFSPTGRYFIAFSSDQTSLEIYEYQGAAVAEHMLLGVDGECTAEGTDQRSIDIRSNIFERFFRLAHTTPVATHTGEHLNRECSLFTDDGCHVIVGCAMYVPDDPYPHFYDMYQNNESVSPSQRSPLEDYALHLIELSSGTLCDSRRFRCDKIFLSHNQGLYLYKDTLAVLSVQHQTIHIFQVSAKGCFIDVRTIGRFCYEDDPLVLAAAYPQMRTGSGSRINASSSSRSYREATINCLKHRLLVHLYRRSQATGEPSELRRFFQHFDQFRNLRMWKMQLLDESHLLIKYGSEDVVTLRTADPNSQPSFFVVYNMATTRVVGVYENTSERLLELFENFSDMFRNASLHAAFCTSSASSNIHARVIQQRFKQTIINAKFGGQTEAIRRLLAQLPISSQSYSSSPYLDLSLFSYDDKWVSVMERPKGCGDHPIRFYARDSGLLKFKIHAGVLGRNAPPTARRLVAFTFHPHDPFAISVQRTNAEYVVNFHIRHYRVD
ncbi:PREDICTED: DET1 homolog isoform X2 [Priapulus caudatus]|nr:PREDICTED: DET1 homolog isoform X2 [Priapulus caudatus]XP_014661587.1 PREDICTED: DET1 homolog isoform X2 [Priapulus caudatus]XP_014661597.1 PREDICTED: DET1 homolog isoform X2 [Priapulus caudatus]